MSKSILFIVVGLILSLAGALFAQEHKHGKDEKHKLGKKPIGDYTVSVIVIGEAEAGERVKFDIKLYDGKSDPKALRVWIGTEDGKGSTKVPGTKETTTYKGEIEVPKPMPAGGKLWVELETESGVKSGSWDLEEHGHKH